MPKLTPERRGSVTLTQRTIMLEDELRQALAGLASMGLFKAEAPKDKRLVRVTLVMEIPGAEER